MFYEKTKKNQRKNTKAPIKKKKVSNGKSGTTAELRRLSIAPRQQLS